MAVADHNEADQEIIENEIKEREAKENMEKIKKNIQEIREKGSTGIWRLKNRFFPKKQTTLPTAKKNMAGKIITNHRELKDVYLAHFSHRMRERPIVPGLEEYKNKLEQDFHKILKATVKIKNNDWDMG